MWKRGKPDDEIIHLRIPQSRVGMVEGVDYATNVACRTGNFHINITNHKHQVTCERCLAVGKIKAWNTRVDDVIHESGTFTMQTPNGIVCIEREEHRPKSERYVAWLQHCDSELSYGETPHVAYSGL